MAACDSLSQGVAADAATPLNWRKWASDATCLATLANEASAFRTVWWLQGVGRWGCGTAERRSGAPQASGITRGALPVWTQGSHQKSGVSLWTPEPANQSCLLLRRRRAYVRAQQRNSAQTWGGPPASPAARRALRARARPRHSSSAMIFFLRSGLTSTEPGFECATRRDSLRLSASTTMRRALAAL